MNKSIIKDIEVKVLEIPLKKQWKISLYGANTRLHVFVKIETEDGMCGYGETAPASAFMGESADTVELIINKYFKPHLVGMNIFNVEKIHSKMNECFYGNYAAKSTIDIAVHDCIGKLLDTPVYNLLGGKSKEKVELSWVVGLQNIENSVEEAKEKVKEGFKTIKLKVGRDNKKDYELVKNVRVALGNDINIRLDANQGYNYYDALEILKKLEELNIESIEQPLNRTNLERMNLLRKKINIPLMVDESISSFFDVQNLMIYKMADSFNIKVGKVGGLFISKKISNIVDAYGMSATVGSNIELGIGTIASAHFATSTKTINMASDLAIGPFLHKNDVIKTNLNIKNGFMECINKPGLGIEIDESIF